MRRLESLAAGAGGHGGRAVRAVGHHGEPARAPAPRAPRHRGALRRPCARVPPRERRGRRERRRAAPAAPRRQTARSTPTTCSDALAGQAHHLPTISALAIENTAMAASGRPWRPDELAAVARRGTRPAALRCTATVHASGTRRSRSTSHPASSSAGLDTVMFCLSKGLGAPVGSLLCGTDDAIGRGARRPGAARRPDAPGGRDRGGRASWRSRPWSSGSPTTTRALGSSPSTSRRCSPAASTPTVVETNIVCARAEALPASLLDDLAAHGVLAGTIDPHTVRFIVHKDVDDEGIDRRVRRARRARRVAPVDCDDGARRRRSRARAGGVRPPRRRRDRGGRDARPLGVGGLCGVAPHRRAGRQGHDGPRRRPRRARRAARRRDRPGGGGARLRRPRASRLPRRRGARHPGAAPGDRARRA